MMTQSMLIGLGVAILSLIISFIIWLIGHKKTSRLMSQISTLEEEKNSAQTNLNKSEELAAKIPMLTEEIAGYKAKENSLREDVTKLTNSLMEEIKKSAAAQEISNKLAKTELLLESAEKTISKDTETISRLTQQITEKNLLTEENNTILRRLKKVMTAS